MNGRGAPQSSTISASLADTTRSRMLLLLERHELTVSELCAVLQLPQSTVSRHLKALADAGWVVVARRGHEQPLHDGARRRSTRRRAGCGRWCASRSGRTAAAAQDQRRLQAALAERRTKSQEFFSSSAGQWDRLRDELFGDRFHLAALAGVCSTPTGRSAISAAAPAR